MRLVECTLAYPRRLARQRAVQLLNHKDLVVDNAWRVVQLYTK